MLLSTILSLSPSLGDLAPQLNSVSKLPTESSETMVQPQSGQTDDSKWLPCTIALWNTRSLVSSINFFQSLVYSRSYDIICITETWLHKNITDSEILPSDYVIHRRDRESRGGGVLVAVKDTIQSKAVSISRTIEMISIQLDIVPKLVVSCVYLPPNCSTEAQEEVLSCFNSLFPTINGKDLILLGDFNLPDINWSTLSPTSPFSNQICDFVNTANLVQVI